MSDEESTPSPRPASKGRDRVEVRVIGGGSYSNYKRGEVDEGQWLDEESEHQLGEDEDVVHLDQEPAPLATRRVEDEELVVAEEPTPRSGKKRLSLRQATAVMAGVALLMAIAVVAGALFYRQYLAAQDDDRRVRSLVPEEQGSGEDELDYEVFMLDAKEAVEESLAVLQQYCDAQNYEEVYDLIRGGSEKAPLLKRFWTPISVVGMLDARLMTGGKANVVVVEGKDPSGQAVEFLLVQEKEGFKIDWEASFGIGDLRFEELVEMEVGTTARMRVSVVRSNFYPLEYPDDRYRSYKIENPRAEKPMYGFVEIGTATAESLSALLGEGSIFFQGVSQARCILVLRNGGRGSKGQFEISKFVENGWMEQ